MQFDSVFDVVGILKKNRHRLFHGFLNASLLTIGLLVSPFLRAEEPKSAEESTPVEELATEAPEKDAIEVVPEEPLRSQSPEEVKAEMLEKLADQLSERMKSLKERARALEAREEALSKREKAIRVRESLLGTMEELMQLREEVIKRREALPPPQSWKTSPAPSTYGRYAAVIDAENLQFFHKKAAETKTPVASTQKLVTALVICLDGGLDQLVEVPKEVYQVEPTVVGVKPGETYTRRQLLTSLLVKSGNDVAATLAIDNAGSIEAFAEKMNVYARTIGMTNSHFMNPHGLPAKGQYSCARDIAIAAFEAYQIPDIREMVKTPKYEFVFNDGRTRTLYNTNRVLTSFPGCNGMKTGFTYAAGNCLVSSASVDGKDRISVIIKSAKPHVWEDSKKLLKWSLDLEFTGETL